MKKILSGMFFRLVRGYEIWALLALFLFAVTYLSYTDVMELNYLSAKYVPGYTYSYDYDNVETVICKDNAEQFCFKNSGISAFDLYRSSVEKIPQEEYDKLSNEMHDNPYYEMETLYLEIQRSFFIPAVLMAIFIPVFVHNAKVTQYNEGVTCLENGSKPCPKAAECRTLGFWRGLDETIRRYTDNFTVADLTRTDSAGYDYII